MIGKRFFKTLLATLVILSAPSSLLIAAQLGSATSPNIIYINADDLGVMDVGFMGDTRYHTPHLDRLASEGMIFSEAYAPAANCAPSRAACLSGQAAPRTGVYTVSTSARGATETRKLIPIKNTLHLSDESVTLADELKACGYVTCQIGKWHVGEDPTRQGFDINIAGDSRGAPRSYFSPYKNPNLSDGPKREYLTDRLTDEAIQFIASHKNKPFFLYLPYFTVHTPLQGREDLVKKNSKRKGIDARYAAMVEALDENIGRLLAYLDKTGLNSKTLVLFSSDNGGVRKFSPQDPYRSGKGSYYEGGIRVPLTVRWPGKIAAGSQSDVPVSGLDFYPTLVELAGGSVAAGKPIDGESLVPLLTGSGSIAKRALYWHFPIYLQKYSNDDGSRDPLFRTRPGSAMRLGKWKLHEYFEDGAFELFNLENDPGERNNLAHTMPEKMEELKKHLSDWREQLNAPVPTQLNPKYIPPPVHKPARTVTSVKLPKPVVPAQAVVSGKPNVIYILADDLGYGDLGCYGQQKLKTPNIDRLANEGLLFSDHYSGNTVCSPSRAVLMTGQHPGKVHCRGNGNEAIAALDPEMTTLPRLFKNAGYTTGAYGKWGLGNTSEAGATNPMTHGFDHFSGWKTQGIAHTYYPTSIIRDGKEIPLAEGTYIHDLIMADAFDFIKKNAMSGQPFFCYIPTAVPHAAMHAPQELHEKWRKVYSKFDGRIAKYGAPKGEPCPPVQNPVAGFAGMMENFDNQIGELLDILESLGVDENTVIFFSSDNGAHKEGGHLPDFWDSNGPLRGYKRDLYEGGIRTPFMVRWPGKITAGSRSAHLSAFWDVLPTMAELTGQPIPEQTDGISFLPTLLRQGNQPQHAYLYHEFILARNKQYTTRALRMGDWKAIQLRNLKTKELQPIELFNLKNDLGETTNLAAQYPELVSKIERHMDAAHTPPKKNR